MTVISQTLIVLWLFILSISVVSVDLRSRHHSLHKHQNPISQRMELKDLQSIQKSLRDGR